MSAAPGKPRFTVPFGEVKMRAEAIDPAASVFLAANAGSGKTTILTNRVVRLLLSGVDPTKILCVTYTKSAAAEMQDRIFKTLADWVRLDDAALEKQIADLTGKPPERRELGKARRLFAQAIETPGGLKLQTIHAFAERLLHLFPFEANVPVRFTVMDEADRASLLENARRAMISAAIAEPEGPLGRAFFDLALAVGEDGFDDLMKKALPLLQGPAKAFADPRERNRDLLGLLGLKSSDSEESIAREMLSCGFNAQDWPDYCETIAASARKKTDAAFVATLQRAIAEPSTARQADILLELLFTKEGGPRKSPVTQDITKPNPEIAEALALAQERLALLLEKRNRYRTFIRSGHLRILADDILNRFTREKHERALTDFDDLIARTLELVSSPGAAWVLQKLDAGIDHVLIDEAQDTTPSMWEIAKALTGEFFAGEGARQGGRTIFAVGDEKQSIYSFQGAKPEAFARSRKHFSDLAAGAGALFHTRELRLSFRTVKDVLSAVDAVFSAPERFTGLSSDGVATVHETARTGAPGLVELWPLVEPPAAEPRDVWEEVDAPGEKSAQVQLASRIARHIATLIRDERFDDDGKPVRAGDVMILVQRRDAFFDAVIRALKREKVSVAGADRLKLANEIAVLDLVAAARAALLVEDDLALAEVLKSPLGGLDDADLMALAPNRTGSLHAALVASAAADPRHAAALAEIEAHRALARTQTPFGFFSHILGPRGGRKKLLARLDFDAAEGIDVFMAEVARREQRDPPSLLAFVEAFRSFDADIKRDQEAAGDAVRVLTVHGAKGLEARIVYLPDPQRLPNLAKDGQMFLEEGHLLWSPRKQDNPDVIEGLAQRDRAAKMDEYRRLLYVAMTRARDRLYIAGWGKPDKIAPDSWRALIEAGLLDSMAEEPGIAGEGPVRRWRETAFSPPEATGAAPAKAADIALPSWIAAAFPQEPVAAPPVRPSHALDAADQPSARPGARARGEAVHLLFERLPSVPAESRAAYAGQLLAARAPRLGERERAGMVARILSLIDAPDLADLFGPLSRGEVDVAGAVEIGGERRPVVGRIDRLAIMADRIIIADFKSGKPAAEGAPDPAHVAQLALYRALLGQLYPGRALECLLVWTGGLVVETIPDAAMDAALAAIKAA